jgi:hypothetical protein
LLQVVESDELTPLIERRVAASAETLRSDFKALKAELQSDIQEIKQRSLRIEAQLQELITRSRQEFV